MSLTGQGRDISDTAFWDSTSRQTVFGFSVVVCLLAGVFGLFLSGSPEFTREVVRALAWIKGLPLDEKLYGISRATHWEGRLHNVGTLLGPAGISIALCLILIRRSRNRLADSGRAAVFTSALLLAFSCREQIQLPFSNPWDIVGRASLAGTNPATPLLQFAVLTLVPALSVGLFDLLSRKGRGEPDTGGLPGTGITAVRKSIVTASLVLLVVFASGDIYTWHQQVPLDTFHEGETLSPAVRWEQGQAPYRDVVIVHGPFHDPIRTVLAFNLFGRSIAAARTMESLLEILAFTLFVVCAYVVFRRSLPAAGVAIAVLVLFTASRPFETGIIIPHRDIMVCLFLLTMLSLYRHAMSQASDRPSAPVAADRPSARISMLLFASAAIPFAAFAYSVDRGSYLLIAWVVGMALLQAAFGWNWRAGYVAAVAAGAVAGILCLGLSIRWAFSDFYQHALRVLPSVHGLGFCLPYPFDDAAGKVPLVLTAFNTSWLLHRLIISVRRSGSVRVGARDCLREHFPEFLLGVIAPLLFLSALGRAGLEHIYYSSGFTFLLTLSILIQHAGRNAFDRLARTAGGRWVAPLAMLTAGVYVGCGMDMPQWYRFPLGAPDEAAIGQSYKETVEFLNDSIDADAGVATLTSEGVWEYLLGRTAPTRFSIAVYALPSFYQDELVQDLKKARTQYIIYRNDHWANAIDGIPWEERLPRVAAYIHAHYQAYRTLKDQQIWRLKEP